jgi:sialate O-acetylesterase
MMKYKIILFWAIAVLQAHAQIRLPKLISDNMVLQRDQPIKIWGWASPKEKIELSFNKKTYKATTSDNGKWELPLSAQAAGTGFEMVLKGKNEVRIKNIAFGDVWLCSGQSNMVIPMERVKEKYPEDIASANYPDIRNFFVQTLTDLNGPKEDFPQGEWKTASPKDVLTFGAITFFFARDIQEKYKVPIGIINSSVGGTPIEAWISEGGYQELGDIQKIIARNKDTSYVNSFNRRLAAFAPARPQVRDAGTIEHWESADYQPKGWRNFNIPGFWEDQGLKDLNGVVWFRREFEVPQSWLGKPVKLYMGRIVDADEMYINGKKIGNITYQYPPRRYEIPSDLLKAGKNTFVIRVTNTAGKGGFVPDKPYFMTVGSEEIDLKGTWQYKIGEVYQPIRFGGIGGGGLVRQNQPTALYNAMIAPVLPMKIKGFLWYQGETNTDRPERYDAFLPALINDWRRLWNDPKLPFLGVQLANFQDINYTPTESNWARLREAQNKAHTLPNTAVAVTIDLGEWNDIHPLNKKDIGKRLALSARNLAYGEKELVHSGPSLKSQRIENGKISLTFDNVAEGITSKDGEELRWFSIADYDKKFVWAKTKIVGKDAIEVWNEAVKSPKYVRYAWQDNPEGVNFYNSVGLPASPFRTDGEIMDETKPWKGKKCAVVLTYDDALNVHLDHAVPLLDSLSLKGTFYIAGSFPGFKNRMNEWKRAAERGHELGNHTLFHPCDASLPERSWVNPENDLSKYTLKRITDEIRLTNTLLESVDGKKQRTFAFTCGDTKVGGVEFMNDLKNDLAGARAVRARMQRFDEINPYDFDSYMINGETGEQLIQLVKQAKNEGKLLVFLFHGVGGEHSLNVSLPAHRELLMYLKENEKEIYIDTMLGVAEQLRALKK